jgi:predicted aspartyl protease
VGRRSRLAKIDTGAGYSSIDEDLAENLGIDLDDPEETVEIDSANGAARPHQGSGE